MECLGGNGYEEEAPLARLYREAPLNGIWEGSGNVICPDVLRSTQKQPARLDVLLEEVNSGGERVSQGAAPTYRLLKDTIGIELQARRIVESIAIALQASLMARHAAHEAADAFCGSRLAGGWGRPFGAVASTASREAIVRPPLARGPPPAPTNPRAILMAELAPQSP